MSNLATVARLTREAVVSRADLTAALALAVNVIERRNTIPILSNVLLRGHGDLLTVTGTDLDIELAVHIPAAADPALFTTLPAHLLSDLVKKAPKSDFVAIQDDTEGHAKADFERANYRLQTLPGSDFPVLTRPETIAAFTLPGSALWDMIDSVQGAISNEETRYYLRGIFCHSLEVNGEMKLRMVTTDGHRLYRRDYPMPEGAADMPGVIIPRKTVEVFQKVTKGKACPDSVTISILGKDGGASKVHFQFGNVEITSKLIDGTFPDYQRVIPSGNDKTARVSMESMIEAITAVSLISSERGRAVKYEFSGNSVRLTVNNPDQGSAEMVIPCAFDGDAMDVGFQAGYMLEMLGEAAPKGGEIEIKLADCGSPTLFTGTRPDWLGVLMPMRV